MCGLGALVNGESLDKLPNGKKVKRQLEMFFSNLCEGNPSLDSVYESAQMKVPVLLAKVLARIMNKSIDKSYAELGLDAHAPSPYLQDDLS